jgi:AcrR family transcriptional regulator
MTPLSDDYTGRRPAYATGDADRDVTVPIGRPQRADARRNRQRILDAAQTLFAGPEGLAVPLDEIAAQAGVGPGTVHRHFPTKDALIAAVTISRLDEVVALAVSRATAEDPGDALREQLAAMLAEGEASTPLKSALAGTEFDLRIAAPDAAAALRSALQVLLRRAQTVGAVRADIDVDDLLSALAGTFHALQYAGEPFGSSRGRRITTMFFDSLASQADLRTR